MELCLFHNQSQHFELRYLIKRESKLLMSSKIITATAEIRFNIVSKRGEDLEYVIKFWK